MQMVLIAQHDFAASI